MAVLLSALPDKAERCQARWAVAKGGAGGGGPDPEASSWEQEAFQPW